MYHPVLRKGIPAADAVLLLVAFGLTQAVGGIALQPTAGTFAVLSVVLAFTGAFRLTRSAVQLTTALGTAGLVLATLLGWMTLGIYSGGYPRRRPGGSACARRHRHAAAGGEERGREGDPRPALRRRAAGDRCARGDPPHCRPRSAQSSNTISMAAGLLIDLPATDAERAKRLKIIQRSGEQMNRLHSGSPEGDHH